MATKKQSKKVSKKKVAKTSNVKKGKKSKSPGIGSFCKGLIMSGKYSRDEIIAKSKKQFPDSAVNSKHISYYVWALKKDDKKVPALKD